jgi:hypothetical protein
VLHFVSDQESVAYKEALKLNTIFHSRCDLHQLRSQAHSRSWQIVLTENEVSKYVQKMIGCCSTGLTLDEQIAEAELMKGEQAEKTVQLRRVKTRPPPVPALNGAMDLNGT